MGSRLHKVVQKFEDNAARGTVAYKSSDDLIRLLTSVLNDALQQGFAGECFYGMYKTELASKLSIGFIGELQSANSDKKRAFLWILIEVEKKLLGATLEEILARKEMYGEFFTT